LLFKSTYISLVLLGEYEELRWKGGTGGGTVEGGGIKEGRRGESYVFTKPTSSKNIQIYQSIKRRVVQRREIKTARTGMNKGE